MRRLLSAVLLLIILFTLASCSDKQTQTNTVEQVDVEDWISAIENEALKSAVIDGKVQLQIEYELPTTLGILRNISSDAEYEYVRYDDLPAVVRNISKYLLGNTLETAENYIAQKGTYTFVKPLRTGISDEVYIVIDRNNRTYKVLTFKKKDKTYTLRKGEHADFKDLYTEKNKDKISKSFPTMIVRESTNETLTCRYTAYSGSDSIEVLYNEKGELLCCTVTSGEEQTSYDGEFYKISTSKCVEIKNVFKKRIERKYKITLPF